jgi:cytochrome c553
VSSFSLRIKQLEKAVELKSQENKEIERQFEEYQNSTEKKMKQLQNEISLWKKKDEETATVNDFYFH